MSERLVHTRDKSMKGWPDKMKFGIVLPSYGRGASRLNLVDSALAAERMGFDSIWATDHLALPKADAERFGHIFEALTTISYLAACTREIRLGFSTLVLPQRNPVEVAKEIATLDALSGGRVIFSAGIGWSAGEYANLGYSFKDRGKRMDEALKVIRTLWRGGKTISFQGKYYRFDQVVLSPAPVQSGGPPLWVAGDSEKALRRAIYFGDGWHPNARPAAMIQAALEKARPLLGERPFTVCVRARLDFGPQADPDSPLGGTPEQVTSQLKAYQAAGVDQVILSIQADSQAARERAMSLFCDQVIPAFRA